MIEGRRAACPSCSCSRIYVRWKVCANVVTRLFIKTFSQHIIGFWLATSKALSPNRASFSGGDLPFILSCRRFSVRLSFKWIYDTQPSPTASCMPLYLELLMFGVTILLPEERTTTGVGRYPAVDGRGMCASMKILHLIISSGFLMSYTSPNISL
jgi:hypothetical protein